MSGFVQRRFLLSMLLLMVLNVLPAVGEDLTARLHELKSASEGVLTEVETLRQEVLHAEQRVQLLSSDVSRLQAREQELSESLDNLLLELQKIEEERERASERVKILERRRVSRIQALDEMSFQAPALITVLTHESINVDDLSLVTAYLEEKDSTESEELLQAEKELREKQLHSEKLLQKQRSLHAGIRDQRLQLSRALQKRQAEEAGVKVKQRKLKMELIKIQAEALKLETVLSSLRSEKASTEDPVTDGTKTPRSRRLMLTLSSSVKRSQRSLREGKLLSPIQGPIVQRFQKASREDPHRNGILLEASSEGGAGTRSVVAVAAGTVSFRGKVPFFGETVILEHAKDEFSLYGGLERSFVKPSEQLGAGQEVGRLGRGGRLYLELRIKGGAINPEPLLTRNAS